MTPIPSWRQRGSTSCSISRCAAAARLQRGHRREGGGAPELLDVVVRHADPADLPLLLEGGERRPALVHLRRISTGQWIW